jgi:hypothetical protein
LRFVAVHLLLVRVLWQASPLGWVNLSIEQGQTHRFWPRWLALGAAMAET